MMAFPSYMMAFPSYQALMICYAGRSEPGERSRRDLELLDNEAQIIRIRFHKETQKSLRVIRFGGPVRAMRSICEGDRQK